MAVEAAAGEAMVEGEAEKAAGAMVVVERVAGAKVEVGKAEAVAGKTAITETLVQAEPTAFLAPMLVPAQPGASSRNLQMARGSMKKYLITAVPLAAIFLVTSAQASSEKKRTLAACTAALAKQNLRPTSVPPTMTFNRKGNRVKVEGKVTGGATFVCKTLENAVVSLEVQ
ncbi:hypothetical protein J2X72_004553 [Phyllobacterium sp. 1468]|uniref:hypothetical protein n=1 Tax=Phyllobacterium sp. 1468 TaxID=2817759 RepID=UPI002865A3A0|nr:hypothetical protein [Phyllobacterium sp. 1468]MDR6635739.1 hypothetical protein [Phyllobacterium sp. 1468]